MKRIEKTTKEELDFEGDSLNEEIDKELLEYFVLFDEFQSKYDSFSENVRSGHLFLSKARYALGPTTLGPLSFDLSTKGLKIEKKKN
mgnify:CR=1 FL=1